MRALSCFFCLALFVCGAAFTYAFAEEKPADTKENRLKAAQRYLKIVSMKALMDDVADGMAKGVPAEEGERIKKAFKEDLDIAALEKASTDAMVKHFSVGEIDALADFYGSPEGRSVMKKLGIYTAEVSQAMNAEIRRAIQAHDR